MKKVIPGLVAFFIAFTIALGADPTINGNPFSTSTKAGGFIDEKGQITLNGWTITNLEVSAWKASFRR